MTIAGGAGEIRQGRRVVARFASWRKNGAVIEFGLVPESINQYWANYGTPTAVAVASRTQFGVWDVAGGDFRAGALQLKVDPSTGQTPLPRVEKRCEP
jgi:hypothetical protein